MRFTEPVNDNGPVIPFCRTVERFVVAENSIDLITDQRHILFGRQLGERFDFFFCGDRTGGICRAVEQDHFRSRSNRLPHVIDTNLEVRVRGDLNDLATGERGEMTIHHKPGIKNDDFVAWVDQSTERQH